MHPRPLLSLLIPTKNRAETARHTIVSLLDIRSNEIEVVVHDNSDNNALRDWVAQHVGDERLRYVHTAAPLSMSRNFELAIEHSRGEFIGALGDDDGVHAGVVDLVRWLQQDGLDALVSTTPATYLWPGLRDEGPRASARLTVKPFTGSRTSGDPEQALRDCVLRGGTRLQGLPTLYHGVVRRSCLEAVHRETGRWLPGVSPDMGAAVAIASHVRRIGVVDCPVFVPGASPRSGAGRGVQRTHKGDLKAETYLDKDLVDAWPDGVPAFFSGPTMWAAAAVQALRATGRQDLLDRFEYAITHAECLVFVPGFRLATLRSLARCSRKSPLELLRNVVRCATGACQAWSRRFASRFERSRSVVIQGAEEDISNIHLTMKLLQERYPSPAASGASSDDSARARTDAA